jgi:hypothetical protein
MASSFSSHRSFQRNLFTEVPAALTLPDLRVLYLGENLLTSYTSFFPELEYLCVHLLTTGPHLFRGSALMSTTVSRS